jgi:hypothetical protein
MPTTDDSFEAIGRSKFGFTAVGPSEVGLYAFFSRAGNDNAPAYRFGILGVGSVSGVRGRAGVPDGPQPTIGPFRGFAGVIGESRDQTGVAGKSVGNIGVYGQTEEN